MYFFFWVGCRRRQAAEDIIPPQSAGCVSSCHNHTHTHAHAHTIMNTGPAAEWAALKPLTYLLAHLFIYVYLKVTRRTNRIKATMWEEEDEERSWIAWWEVRFTGTQQSWLSFVMTQLCLLLLCNVGGRMRRRRKKSRSGRRLPRTIGWGLRRVGGTDSDWSRMETCCFPHSSFAWGGRAWKRKKSSKCIFYLSEIREGSQSESRKRCGDAKELVKNWLKKQLRNTDWQYRC